jgi:hypothetical protein
LEFGIEERNPTWSLATICRNQHMKNKSNTPVSEFFKDSENVRKIFFG